MKFSSKLFARETVQSHTWKYTEKDKRTLIIEHRFQTICCQTLLQPGNRSLTIISLRFIYCYFGRMSFVVSRGELSVLNRLITMIFLLSGLFELILTKRIDILCRSVSIKSI